MPGQMQYAEPDGATSPRLPASWRWPRPAGELEVLTDPWNEEDARITEYMLCGCVPSTLAGVFVCALVIAEGIVATVNVYGNSGMVEGWIGGLRTNYPSVYRVEWIAIGILGPGDFLFAAFGLASLWLCSASVPLSWRQFRKCHAEIAANCIASLKFWRIAVTLLGVPWIGFLLAFDQELDQGRFLACFFVWAASNCLVLCGLLAIYRSIVSESCMVQHHLDLQTDAERQHLLDMAHHAGWPEYPAGVPWPPEPEEPSLFLLFPLEWIVGLYALACVVVLTMLTLAEVVAAIVAPAGWTAGAGGWTFFSPPDNDVTFWLEVFAYISGAVGGLCGIVGICLYRGACDSAQCAESREAFERAYVTKGRCATFVLFFLVLDLLRVALFVPITGMALAEKDLCRLYSRGLEGIGMGYGNGLHCSTQDTAELCWVLAVMALDVYCLCGAYRVWHFYRRGYSPAWDGALNALVATKHGYTDVRTVAQGHLDRATDHAKGAYGAVTGAVRATAGQMMVDTTEALFPENEDGHHGAVAYIAA